MFTKAELKAFLSEICTEAHFVKVEFESDEKFLVAIKCKIETDAGIEYYNQYFTDWMKKFSQFTTTNWIVRHSFPKLVRMVYRKIYTCHLSNFNKSKNAAYDKSRNKNCSAKIHFKIKKIGRGTIRNDPLLKRNLNLNILIDYSHSHSTRDKENFNLLKSSEEIDQLFYDYFDRGFQPSSAKYYHELILTEKYGDNGDHLLNATINPTTRHVNYLFVKKFKRSVPKAKSVQNLIEDKKTDLENAGGTLIYTENAELAVVVTPFMKRVFQALDAGIVIVDSTMINQCVVTFFYLPSRIGALPIACALHTSQEEANLSQALLTVKITLESNECNSIFDPKILVTSDLKELKKAVECVFPSAIRFSLVYDMSRMFWAWLCDEENNLNRKKRNPLMVLFRNMLTSTDSDSSERLYKELLSHEYMTPKAREYVTQAWSTYFLCGQLHLYCDRSVLEALLVFFKEFIIQRCKSFNMSAIVDVLVNVLEPHLNKLVLNYVKGRQTLAFLTKFLAKTKDIMDFGNGLQKSTAKEFRMPSQGKTKRHFTFRTDTFCCDCCVGARGQFCEHLCAIIDQIDTDFRTLPALNENETDFFTRLVSKTITDEDNASLKLEIPVFNNDDEEEEIKVKTEFEKDFIGDDDDDDMDEKLSSSPKHEVDDDSGYYLLDVKSQREGNDPLEEIVYDEDDVALASTSTGRVEQSPEEFKEDYDKAMKDINNEFRRLNKLFKTNANKCNLATMVKLTEELAKIRPIERVNLKNLAIELNEDDDSSGKKRKLNDAK